MTLQDLNMLVQSLSKSERNIFVRIHSAHGQHTNYFKLFTFLTDHPYLEYQQLVRRLATMHPDVQIESTAQYLMKLVSDQLVLCRVNQDDWYRQYFGIMKAKLFSERSLEDRALRELGKVEKLADLHQNYNSLHQASRMELSILSARGFDLMDEQHLINKQMKLKSILQRSKQLHDHYSLFELLSYRFIRDNVTDKQDPAIQDLIINELSLSSRGNKDIFQMQKTHLMFQSFFFIRVGEYNSALKIFDKLIRLFEQHERLWNSPPYDYLSTLDGILDSLRSIGFVDEMEKYLLTLNQLVEVSYTNHFNQQARLTLLCYRFYSIIIRCDLNAAKSLLAEITLDSDIFNPGFFSEKAAELNFYIALTEFLTGNLKKARKILAHNNEYNAKKSPISRARRLLSIVINFAIGDSALIEYDIRSYKRYFSKNSMLLKTEKMIFNFMLSAPQRKSKIWKSRYVQRIEKQVEEIRTNKKEIELNKFYSFSEWVVSYLT